MPESFVKGLDDNARKTSIDLLNACLADTEAMTLAVKQAHWNLKGRGFIGVHELLDDAAQHLRDAADLMAERAVILGGYAKGTVEEAARKTRIEAYPLEIEKIDDHIVALTDRYLEFGKTLREALEAAGEAGDDDTEDLFTEVSRTVDKDAWFIGANRPN
ncbi:DNA starvation/stationary phase protection protein Dps [Histidinibacterium aquaticum]|uniref:DNA starvation/stationary phase protection protein Dps n=1 Tax=Histidinibacterium aquaticum TaxID=2613962 RepID=A0A5J5GDA2_9RHOB|nr:DNA starvation/stationary phase protection protein Dps [Histidinibacterium aquaticum]KAA9006007.1 DNA starvation/stationary phase protection protein Dps [Histidinibacterium aquaticum]